MLEEIYLNGSYLEKNPGWHIEESPWKVKHILRMLKRHDLLPQTICEVGCGAGDVLRLLQVHMNNTCELYGYDISPQAFELCKDKANEMLHFKLADIRQEKSTSFDLALILDVIEHIEDYFVFLRDIRGKSHYKIFHIPLELSVQTVLRGKTLIGNRDAHGHIHYFTKETAFRTLQDTGYEILDYSYSPQYELDASSLSTNLMKLPRRFLFAMHRDWAVRLLGGARLLVLAK